MYAVLHVDMHEPINFCQIDVMLYLPIITLYSVNLSPENNSEEY